MKDRIKLKDSNSFAGRLRKDGWWEEGNECLNMYDINRPPKYYPGTMKEWIEELTTYIDLYPAVWQSVYEQYKALNKTKSVLQFYRNDEGYLRIVGVDAVYLKIAGEDEPLSHEVLNRIGQRLSGRAEELFYTFLEYAGMDDQGKKCWMERIEKNIQENLTRQDLTVTMTETLDESAFAGDELYFDLLNDLYIIL